MQVGSGESAKLRFAYLALTEKEKDVFHSAVATATGRVLGVGFIPKVSKRELLAMTNEWLKTQDVLKRVEGGLLGGIA
jgi:hypothetical protein